MLATKAGPNQYRACRVFKLESSGAVGETGSEGGEAGGMARILDFSCCEFSIACISVFLLTIVNDSSQSGPAAVVLPQFPATGLVH